MSASPSFQCAPAGRAYRQRAAGKALAQVVVGLAMQCDLLPLLQKRAEGLPAAAVNLYIRAARQRRAESAVGGGEGALAALVGAVFQVQVVGAARAAAGVAGEAEQRGKVDGRAFLYFEQVGAAHELFHGARAQPRHNLAQLSGDEEHESFHVFRLADEAFAQFWILRGDAEGARSQVADAHHAAAQGHKRRGGEAEFLRAQQQGDGHVVARSSACRPFPASRIGAGRCGRVPDAPRPARSPRGRPAWWTLLIGAAPVPPSPPEMRMPLAPALATPLAMVPTPPEETSLTVMRASSLAHLQVVDEFGEILYGVDVVVRRRGDEGDARRGAARPRHVLRDLGAGQMAALAGLGALRHFDLYLFGGEQVVARDAKAARGHLLDGGVARRAKALGQFAALAAVGFATQMVHGQRHALVRFPRNGAVGHGSGLEAAHDALRRLDFLQRHGLAALVAEGQQRADGARAIVFHHGGVAVEERAVVVPQRLLQRVDDLRAVEMFLRAIAGAQAVAADAGQRPRRRAGQKRRGCDGSGCLLRCGAGPCRPDSGACW